MKRLFSIVIMLLLAVILAVPMAAQEASELVIWSQYDLTDDESANAVTLREKIAAFEESTGITVVYEQVAWDQLAPKLAVAVQSGGDVPDIVEAGSQHIPSLLDAGALTAMDDLLADEEWTAELTEGDSQACVIEDVRYCVAHNVRGGMSYYQIDALEGEFPKTAEEWLAASSEFSGEPFLSTQFAGRSYGAVEIMWWPQIFSNGGRIFDDEGQPAWATEEVAEVVEFNRAIYGGGALPASNITGDFSDAEAPWIDGNSVSFRGGSWSAIFVPGLLDAVEAGEVGMTGGIAFGDGDAHVFMVSEGWIIPSGAANPEGGVAWIREFMEPEFLSAWASAQFGIPTTEAAYAIGGFDQSTFYSQVDEILGTQGLYMEQSPYYVESLDALAVALQELMLDPEMDAMTRLQEAADEVLNRYW